jgi:hypothetical protein
MLPFRALLLGLMLGLSGCSFSSEAGLPVMPDGAGTSCDHVWSSRYVTRLACEFGVVSADNARR